ncbi:diguanylate cyclase domain-containing protein [Fusobacterium varium]
MEKTNSWEKIMGFLVFILMTVILILVNIHICKRQKQVNIKHGEYLLNNKINQIQYSIDSRLLKLKILEMVIIDNNGKIRDFNEIAERLYEDDPSIRSLQLAPNGDVTYVYPLKGNEDAFGDIFSDPDRKIEAEYARDSGNMTLAGPFELYQKGIGVVARRPIYLKDSNKKKQFWGFSIAVMNVPEIFDKADLKILDKEGYLYKIWRNIPDSFEKQVIVKNFEEDIEESIQGEIYVPGGVWFLNIVPKNGWISFEYIISKIFIAIFISFLVALVIYGLMISKRKSRELVLLANTDSLTGLYNERFLSKLLNELINSKISFGLLYLDLDKFKEVNDNYGHKVGDLLLIEVANRLKSCVDSSDFVFRIGGDEFAIIIKNNREKDFYIKLLEKIHVVVEQPFYITNCYLIPRISGGYSIYPDEYKNSDEMIKKADKMMYKNKLKREKENLAI